MATTPISKVKLPDGTIHDFSTTHYIVLPENSKYDVTWNVENFVGDTSLISGTTDDYLLSIGKWDISDILSKTSQTKNGCTVMWDEPNYSFSVTTTPTANTHFVLYENATGFPTGVGPGSRIIHGCRSGYSSITMYLRYKTASGSFTNLRASYSGSSLAYSVIPSDAVGIQFTIYVTTAFDGVSTQFYPAIIVQNYFDAM